MEIIQRVLPMNRVARKYLQKTQDGFVVETTCIRRPEKHILCVSTQIGCVIGCRFCASGLRSDGAKYQRSLTAAEMVVQCENIIKEIDFFAHPLPLLFSLMGEGEPFLNFDACVEMFHRIASITLPVHARAAVSTSGIRPDLILRLGEMNFTTPLKLRISLHGPDDNIRRQIVPVTKPLAEIVAAARAYRERCVHSANRTIEWNYVLCAGVNDQLEHARSLVGLLGSGWHIQFNRLNLVAGLPFCRPSWEQAKQFRGILESCGITTEYYETDESFIGSGCGQLSYQFGKDPTPQSL